MGRSMAVMRPPWFGGGGYGTALDTMGADDFVLALSDTSVSDGKGACVHLVRVQAPKNVDQLIQPNNSHALLSSDRTVRPWMRLETSLGHCVAAAAPGRDISFS